MAEVVSTLGWIVSKGDCWHALAEMGRIVAHEKRKDSAGNRSLGACVATGGCKYALEKWACTWVKKSKALNRTGAKAECDKG